MGEFEYVDADFVAHEADCQTMISLDVCYFSVLAPFAPWTDGQLMLCEQALEEIRAYTRHNAEPRECAGPGSFQLRQLDTTMWRLSRALRVDRPNCPPGSTGAPSFPAI